MADSMQEARKLIQERLVKGDGRVLDCLGKASEIQESELLKKYLREITHAVEISSIQNAAEAVEDLQDTVNKAKEIRGSEIFELVYAACLLYTSGIEPYHIWKNEEDHTAGDVKDGVPFQPDR